MSETPSNFPYPALTIERQTGRHRWASARLVLALLMFFFGGCEWPYQNVSEVSQPSNERRGAADNGNSIDQTSADTQVSIFNRPLERIAVDFRVHLISAPTSTFDDGSRLWSIARGNLPNADLALHLASNGFRAAIGRNSDRDALTKFLDQTAGVRLAMDEVTPNVDRPVTVELGAGPAWTSIFIFDRRGNLRGTDLTDVRLRFIMRFEFRSASLREVMLRVVPEVEEPPGPVRWVKDAEGRYREEPEERKQTFADLEITADIPDGGFLVIGPDGKSRDKALLGRLFFTDERAVVDDSVVEPTTQPVVGEVTSRDRIYIISPIVRNIEAPSARMRTP